MTDSTQSDGMATLAEWEAFMRPIAAAVRNTPAEKEFKARMVAIAALQQQLRRLFFFV